MSREPKTRQRSLLPPRLHLGLHSLAAHREHIPTHLVSDMVILAVWRSGHGLPMPRAEYLSRGRGDKEVTWTMSTPERQDSEHSIVAAGSTLHGVLIWGAALYINADGDRQAWLDRLLDKELALAA